MADSNLRDINIDLIDRNPENPRIVFRPGELSQLIESIRKLGVQVPISVYKEGRRFVLIDGERRWKSCIKLNKKSIPALVQDKPDQLTNLLLMFNIHALREQWDLLTIAMKLPRVIELLQTRLGRKPTEREISADTGLAQGVVRRCKLLIDLPKHHQQTILRELQKPKPQQKLTEDFFIEMERSLTTVERNLPDVVKHYGRETIRQQLIAKYKNGTITNRVDFRQIAKIARAENVSADARKAEVALTKLFADNRYSIEQAFTDSVSAAYEERGLLSRISGLSDALKEAAPDSLDDDVLDSLKELNALIHWLLEAA
jgi:ParB family chromosome partitioning protein